MDLTFASRMTGGSAYTRVTRLSRDASAVGESDPDGDAGRLLECPTRRDVYLEWHLRNTVAGRCGWKWADTLSGELLWGSIVPPFMLTSVVLDILAKMSVLAPEWSAFRIASCFISLLFFCVCDLNIARRLLKSFECWFMVFQTAIAGILFADMFEWDVRGWASVAVGVLESLAGVLSDSGPPETFRTLHISVGIDAIVYTFFALGVNFDWFQNLRIRVTQVGQATWSTSESYISRCFTIVVFSLKYFYNSLKYRGQACHILRQGPVMRRT
eukprot:GFYU01047320.1.p1 GENE.GFYU01047320.1~~GFYU01047320.1.p1  ORF type:complete len:271 (-),score=26.13 GFYU01047320.1:73-885(-)